MPSGRSTYVVVRAHGLGTHLIPEDRLRSWALIEDDSRLLSELANTEYGPFFDSPEDLRDPKAIERNSARVFGLRVRRIISLTSDPLRRLIRVYSARYDLENLRRIVYALMAGRKGEIEGAMLPLSGFLLDVGVLSKAEDLGELVQLVREAEVRSALESWRSSDGEDLSRLDVRLETAHGEMVNKAAAATGDARTEGVLREIVERRLLAIALKLHYEGRDVKGFSELFRGKIGGHALRAVFEAGDLEDAITRLSGLEEYKSAALLMLDSLKRVGEPWVMELALFRDAVGRTRRVASRYPLDKPYVLWYVVECEWEWTRFKTLLLGRVSGILGPELYDLLAAGRGK